MGSRLTENLIKHPRCPFCHDEVRPDEREEEKGRGCSTCLSWSHAACWTEHGGCAACGQQPETKPVVRVEPRAREPVEATHESGEDAHELGSPGRGYLGIGYADHPHGVRVTHVALGSPAALAGLRQGDVIRTVNAWRAQTSSLRPALRKSQAGEEWDFEVERAGREWPLTVELSQHPQRGWLGVIHKPALPGLHGGARLMHVTPNSPADLVGLQVGDVIEAVDGQEIASVDLRRILTSSLPGQTLELRVARRKAATRTVKVTLDVENLTSATDFGSLLKVLGSVVGMFAAVVVFVFLIALILGTL